MQAWSGNMPANIAFSGSVIVKRRTMSLQVAICNNYTIDCPPARGDNP